MARAMNSMPAYSKYAGTLLGPGRRFIGTVTAIVVRPSINGCARDLKPQTYASDLTALANTPQLCDEPSVIVIQYVHLTALSVSCAATARVPKPLRRDACNGRAAKGSARVMSGGVPPPEL